MNRCRDGSQDNLLPQMGQRAADGGPASRSVRWPAPALPAARVQRQTSIRITRRNASPAGAWQACGMRFCCQWPKGVPETGFQNDVMTCAVHYLKTGH